MIILNEHLTFNQAKLNVSLTEGNNGKKDMHMSGIFLQGGIKNQNQRVYPVNEISHAVNSLMEKIQQGQSILGEVDHPEELTINLDRVSHMITEMWMDGPNGMGKLKIIPTPMGKIVETMLEAGVKLGVSSRGSGNVESNGMVEGFDIATVDIVAQPSAPDAYPTTIYESLWRNERRGDVLFELARASQHDPRAQKFLKEDLVKLIRDM